MAIEETEITHSIQLDLSPFGVRLFKNVRGLFWTMDKKRKIKAGLMAQGSGDLIGWTPVKITQYMVGSTIAVFTSIECKTKTGSAFQEQRDWINVVQKSGGFAGVARSPEDSRRICKIVVD
jgi:hypothetical protein